ncbi:type I-E CRISPR-associated protein Cas5/CasD [uncultured Subdoligranulum sp.]|uniref:type I-E CRISPR-associated protein Cas5/CasD n=1 Tax=uncultured Subdoligranulum sp. TaxID=512298 RepID=UPI002608CBB4|nr:type I-E CRISPR-associated protein Cas5/CasD [uncultured Subdoligranulum sp.]
MATLLLRLAAPLQSWGADSKFETRKTEREPTKSGVIGLLAAALGLRRDDDAGLQPLCGLRFGVRIDREGELLVDFHTAGNPTPQQVRAARRNGKVPGARYVTQRHYLADAVFLVGLESEDEALLQKLVWALGHPAYPLFLGRRSCPPTLPLCLGIRPLPLEAALRAEPAQTSDAAGQEIRCRIVMDADLAQPGAAPRRDLPCSFSPIHRQYAYRAAAESEIVLQPAAGPDGLETEHDPFAEL